MCAAVRCSSWRVARASRIASLARYIEKVRLNVSHDEHVFAGVAIYGYEPLSALLALVVSNLYLPYATLASYIS